MKFLGKKLVPHTGPFIVAEISCNHGGSLDEALKLIDAAKLAGADAVKIQAYTADEMTINTDMLMKDFICKKGPWEGEHLYDLYLKNKTPLEWLPTLFNMAKQSNIPMFASVFGEQSLEALEKVGCPAYKIASFEANNIPLLKKIRKTVNGKPVIISTGCSTLDEVDDAVNTLIYNTIIMHCVSKYPTQFSELSLSRIPQFIRIYDVPIGFSDHCNDGEAALCAITAGASIIEKHLSLSPNTDDGEFSLSPIVFKHYVDMCKEATKAWKDTIEPNNQYKRSIYVVKDIKSGEHFTNENVSCIRPSYGLPPHMYYNVLTKTATRDINRGEALVTDMVKWIK